MKHRIILWLTLGLFGLLIAACGLVGSKADTIDCTGIQKHSIVEDEGERTFVEGNFHYEGWISKYNLESNCPELTGVLTVTLNSYLDYGVGGPQWGTFYFETAYDGGGTFEGTFHGKQNDNGYFIVESESHNSTGSLRGLTLTLNIKDPATGSFNANFNATIQNPSSE
jgi:hypothetical protein